MNHSTNKPYFYIIIMLQRQYMQYNKVFISIIFWKPNNNQIYLD